MQGRRETLPESTEHKRDRDGKLPRGIRYTAGVIPDESELQVTSKLARLKVTAGAGNSIRSRRVFRALPIRGQTDRA